VKIAAAWMCLFLLAACATAPGTSDYRRYEQWQIASLTMAGQAKDVSDIQVRHFVPDPSSGQLLLALRACNSIRFRWDLINQKEQRAHLRTREAVASTDSCDPPKALDVALQSHLRNANSVHFGFERIEIESANGRLVLEPH
jgi:hypothetical protein